MELSPYTSLKAPAAALKSTALAEERVSILTIGVADSYRSLPQAVNSNPDINIGINLIAQLFLQI